MAGDENVTVPLRQLAGVLHERAAQRLQLRCPLVDDFIDILALDLGWWLSVITAKIRGVHVHMLAAKACRRNVTQHVSVHGGRPSGMLSLAQVRMRTASSVAAVTVGAAWLPLGSASDVVDGTAAEVAAGEELLAGTAPRPAKENGALDGADTKLLAAAGAAVTLGGARLRAATPGKTSAHSCCAHVLIRRTEDLPRPEPDFNRMVCARVDVGISTVAADVAAAPLAIEPKAGAKAAALKAGCDSALAELRMLPDAGVLAEGAAAALDAAAPGNVKAGKAAVLDADAADAPLPKLLPALILSLKQRLV